MYCTALYVAPTRDDRVSSVCTDLAYSSIQEVVLSLLNLATLGCYRRRCYNTYVATVGS
jgi:hypothetical protein